jgi:hypothetical protein
MGHALIQFVVICLLCAFALWAIKQFPTLDGTIVKFIQIAILIVLSLLFINLILVSLLGTSLGGILR